MKIYTGFINTFKIIILLIIVMPGYSKNHLVFMGGTNILVNKIRNYIPSTGLSAGILIPIKISELAFHYRIHLAHHKSNYFSNYKSYYCYTTCSNEFLIGKNIPLKKPYQIIPQFGVGFMIEYFWRKNGKAYVHYNNHFYYNLSVQIKYPIKNLGAGLLINYQDDLLYGYKYSDMIARFGISILIYI